MPAEKLNPEEKLTIRATQTSRARMITAFLCLIKRVRVLQGERDASIVKSV